MSHFIRLILTVAAAACLAVALRAWVLPEPAPVVEYRIQEKPVLPVVEKKTEAIAAKGEEAEPLRAVGKMRLAGVWHVWLSDGRKLRTDRPNYDGLEEIGPNWVIVEGQKLEFRRP